MSEVASLNIDLSLLSAKFQEGMARAKMAMTDFEKSVKPIARSFDKFGKQLEKTGDSLTKNLTMPIAAVTAALGAALYKTAQYGDEINNMSVRTGISRGELQELKFAAGQVGVEFNSLVTANKEVTKSIGEVATGNKKTSDLFSQLGVSVKDSNGNLRSSGAVMNDLIGALSRVENETTRNIIGQELFGKSYVELIPLVKQGKDGLKNFADEARAAGLVMSDDAVIAADDFGDKMDKLKAQLGHAGMEIASAFMPMVLELADFISNKVVPALKGAADWFKGLSDTQKKWVVGIAGALAAAGPLVSMIGKMIGMVGTLVSWLPKLAMLTGPIGLIAIAIATAAALIIANWDSIVQYFSSGPGAQMWDDLKVAASAALDGITSLIGAAVDLIGGLWDKFRADIMEGLTGAFKFATGLLTNQLAFIGDLLSAFSALLKGDWSGLWDSLVSMVVNAFQLIVKVIAKGFDLSLAAIQKLSGFISQDMAKSIGQARQGFSLMSDVLLTFTDRFKRSGEETVKQASFLEQLTAATVPAETVVKSLGVSIGGTTEKAKAFHNEMGNFNLQDHINAVDRSKLAVDEYGRVLSELPVDIENTKSVLSGFGQEFNDVTTGITVKSMEMSGVIMDMSQVVQGAIESTAVAVGEAVGNMATGMGGIGGVLNAVMMGIADFVGNFGKAMIAASTAAMLAKAALATPASLAAGIALVSLGAVLKNVISSKPMGFADGGLVMGETLGLVGEGRGTTRSNPEVIAPLDKLRDFMPGGDGGASGQLEFIISGESLRAVLSKNNTNRRFGGTV